MAACEFPSREKLSVNNGWRLFSASLFPEKHEAPHRASKPGREPVITAKPKALNLEHKPPMKEVGSIWALSSIKTLHE